MVTEERDRVGNLVIIGIKKVYENKFHSSFKFFCNYLILKGLSKMLSFKKINNFNMLHKFQEKT